MRFAMIDRICHQIWIGPLAPPLKWMQTWKDLNPNWEYIYWDNDKVFSRKWHNQHLIDEYVRRYKASPNVFTRANGKVYRREKATLFHWHAIADLLRYEILYEYGGYMPGADSVCLRNIDDKFKPDCELYTLRTGNLFVDKLKRLKSEGSTDLDRYRYENASPILAAKKHHPFLKACIDELSKLKSEDLGEAVDTTGNVFMGKMIRKYKPDIVMPDYVLRADRVNPYSLHYAGTTRGSYGKGR